MKLKIFQKISLAFCAVIMCVALALALLVPTVAQAYKTTQNLSGAKQVGEIFKANDTTGGTFDKTNLETLLKELGATSGSTLQQTVANLQGSIDTSSTVLGDQTFSDTQRIYNKYIVVEFGGIKWIAAFLSLADSDLVQSKGTTGNEPNAKDVILTLWQAEVSNTNENKSTWSATGNGYGTSSENQDVNYPANMYGTSYIRAVTLNNGGVYAKGVNTTENYKQVNTNKYAKFNMSEYSEGDTTKKSNISQFLVAPRYLKWQQTEHIPSTWNWGSKGKSHNNEAWGTVGSTNYYNSSIYYEGKSNYAQWKDDLIWLPSSTEVGNENSGVENTGIWAMDKTNQRSADDIAWLRTADGDYYYSARGLTADGAYDGGAVSAAHLVRPALHLNLTSAAKAANTVEKPSVQNKTVVYNGQAQTIELGINTELVTSKKIKIEVASDNHVSVAATDSGNKQVVSATQAGTYTISITPDSGYVWEDSNDTAAVTVTFKIEKRKVTLAVKLPESVSSTLTYGTSFDLSSATSNVSDYWSYVDGSVDSDNGIYTPGQNYHFLNADLNKLTVNTPTANQQQGDFRTPGKYPVYLEVSGSYKADMEKNYDLNFQGDYSEVGAASGYDQYYGKAATITVKKAKIKVTANPATIKYGQAANNAGVTYSGTTYSDNNGFAPGEDEKSLQGNLAFTYIGYKVGDPVSTYNDVIEPGGLTSTNYEIEFVKGTLTVTAKEITVAISNATHRYGMAVATLGIEDPEDGWVNEGDKETLLAAVKELFKLKKQGGDNGEVELTSKLEVGTYDITVANNTYGNYTVTFTNGTYEVTKGKVTITPENVEISYGDQAKNNGVRGEGFADGESVKDLQGSPEFSYGEYTATTGKYSGVGEYAISVQGYSSNNYEIEYKTGTLKVNPKVITLSIKSATHVYGATPQKLEIDTSSLGDGVFVNLNDQKILNDIVLVLKKQGTSEEVTLDSSLEVGTYDITAENGNYGNYTVSIGNGVYTVTAATITSSQSSTLESQFYNYEQDSPRRYEIRVDASKYTVAKDQALTFTYRDLKKDGATTYSDFETDSNGIISVWKVGTYTVTVTVSAPNHTSIEQTLTFQILSTELDLTLLGQTITKPFGEEIGYVNDLVFDNVTVYAIGFTGTTEALKNVLIFSIKVSEGNEQTTVSILNQGYYTLKVKVADGEGFTLKDGKDSFEDMVRISQARLNVDAIVWDLEYTYSIGGNGSPITRQLKIDETVVRTVGNVAVKVVYGDISTTTSLEYCTKAEGTGIYTVYKAGTYSVTVTISAENHDDYVGTLRMVIHKATANVQPSYDNSAVIWTSGSLPEITSVAYVDGHVVEGKIMWTTSLGTIKATDFAYIDWQWVPEDREDIDITTGQEYLFIRFAAVDGITLEFDPADRVFFDTTPITDLKNYLTVTVTFTDGTSRKLGQSEYELTCNGGSTLVAGEGVTINVSFLSGDSVITQSFTVDVLETEKEPEPIEKQVDGLLITFTPNGRTFYDTDNINDLKNYLTVVVQFNDKTVHTLTKSEYTLTCQDGTTLFAGDDVRIFVTYMFNGLPIVSSFTVDVASYDPTNPSDPASKQVERVDIEFNPNGRTFYDTDELSELKNYLTVTVFYDNNTQKVLALSAYALSCEGGLSFVAGDGVRITVTFLHNGNYVSESFNMDVASADIKVDPTPTEPDKRIFRVDVGVDLKGRTFYNTDEISELKNYLTVTVIYIDGTTRTLALNEYDLTCEGGTGLVSGDNVRIVVTFRNSNSYVSQSFTMKVAVNPDNPNGGGNGQTNNPSNPGNTSEPFSIKSLINKVRDWCKNTPMPLGYASIALGVMLLLIIILAIAARKPKKKKK
ncbi:MAG: hypothetical protein J1F66_05495 [Clostridiales bacterium]|nr:hypothetical protein [Clostridiales bacterium]